MIKEIMRDEAFLSLPSEPAGADCAAVCDDLTDTLRVNADRCVGMAANMIGVRRAVIVFEDNGKISEMLDPVILKKEGLYEAREGCLSLAGTRVAKRYKKIRVSWMTRDLKPRVKNFEGFTAQIIQHELDHIAGKII